MLNSLALFLDHLLGEGQVRQVMSEQEDWVRTLRAVQGRSIQQQLRGRSGLER